MRLIFSSISAHWPVEVQIIQLLYHHPEVTVGGGPSICQFASVKRFDEFGS